MTVDYLLKRIGLFLLVVWAAATINFIVPRLQPQDPVLIRMERELAQGGSAQHGIREMAEQYQKKFGLDRPLWAQYATYMWDISRLQFGYSITHYPKPVSTVLRDGLPWTIGLLTTATVISFVIGSLLGGLFAWAKTPRYLTFLMPIFFTLYAVPYYLLGMILLYIFAFQAQWFPAFGGYSPGTIPELSVSFWREVFRHSLLPALSVILGVTGFWALGMRAMMVTAQDEDYMILAEAKGLKESRIFFRYAMRNALLPQTTQFALTLGSLVSGFVLVEIIFGYPGIGFQLFRAIHNFDYPVIQGIVMILIITIAVAMLVIDLIYPLLDPRISYRRR